MLTSPERQKPTFTIAKASQALLTSLRLEGPPERKPWHPSSLEEASHPLFRLHAVELPTKPPPADKKAPLVPSTDKQEALRKELKYLGFVGGTRVPPPEAPAEVDSDESDEEKPEEKPKTRAERYFQALMQAHDDREKGWVNAIAQKELARKELAATRALQRVVQADQQQLKAAGIAEGTRTPSSSRSSGSGSGSTDSKEKGSELDEGELELQPYPGVMKVQLEVLVHCAPGEEDADDDSSEGGASGKGRRKSSKRSNKQDGSGSGESSEEEELDIAAELAKLKEFEDAAKKDQDVPDDQEIGPGGRRRIRNIWDAPDPRWAIGLGGTVFFMPEAERYSLGPSLPPPPPPSLLGRRRMRLKPRLPLDISSGRYRDEHPNIWPEGVPTATAADRQRLESKLMTFEFYDGCSRSMTELRRTADPMATPKQLRSTEAAFGKSVWKHTQTGAGWTMNRQRDQVKNKRIDDRKKQLALAETEAALKAEKKKRAEKAAAEFAQMSMQSS